MPLKIGIDCRLAGRAHGGIGRYIQNLVVRLPHLAVDIKWVLFFSDQTQADEVLSEVKDTPMMDRIRLVFAPVKHYSLAEQLKMPKIFGKEKLDLLHVPHFNIPFFYRGKIVVTVHDLLWHEYKGMQVTTLPQWQYLLKYWFYKCIVRHAVQRASKIFVPAETIKKTVEKYYPKVGAKIVVTKEGVEKTWEKLVNENKKNHPKRVKTLVYVGSLYPHKNVRLVIDALSDLPEYTLVLVGTRNVFQDDIRDYVQGKKLTKQVEFAGYLSDEKLIDLLQHSFALVQPSLSEGFGLTGIEAMATETPVLASNISIFQEIYRDSAIFFNPLDAESFVKAVKKLEEHGSEKYVRKGKKLLTQYSWDEMAKNTFGYYMTVLHYS